MKRLAVLVTLAILLAGLALVSLSVAGASTPNAEAGQVVGAALKINTRLPELDIRSWPSRT